MFKCRDCGEYFEEPKELTDWVEFWGSNVPMYSYICPHCTSDNFDEDYVVEEEEELESEDEDD